MIRVRRDPRRRRPEEPAELGDETDVDTTRTMGDVWVDQQTTVTVSLCHAPLSVLFFSGPFPPGPVFSGATRRFGLEPGDQPANPPPLWN